VIEPYQLIGLPYRLGATPDRHGAADCLSLSRAVLRWHGIDSPTPERSWYQRLRRGDFTVFTEQLDTWGRRTERATVGVIGLGCNADATCGLVAFYEDGWLHFNQSRVVTWTPQTLLTPAALYCQAKSSCATPSD
jgi:cell wall-associated NlpC family hydrolase